MIAKRVILWVVLAAWLAPTAVFAGQKSKVTTCTSYTNINGTTKTTCRTK
jgi:hypothetical protein